ncbi:hypothetical protein [Micromonospora sp. NPDC005324]
MSARTAVDPVVAALLATSSGGFGAYTNSLIVPASAAWQWDAIRLL